MAYRGGFVVNLIRNGKVIEGENGTVAIPFGTEYKLRLRNKNTRDAVAKVIIDGRDATSAGDLIIHAGEDTEIERFIDSIRSGNRFKFIPVENMSENEKNNHSNGIIEVKFRLKKEVTERIIYHEPIVEEHHYYRYPKKRIIWHDYSEPYQSYPYYPLTYSSSNKITAKCFNPNVSFSDSSNTAYTCSAGNVNYCSTDRTTFKDCLINDISDVETGKTVEGGHSSQLFEYSYLGELETKETVIKLKIVGYKDGVFPVENCQGLKYKWCSRCGSQIIIEKDLVPKFCEQCGGKL